MKVPFLDLKKQHQKIAPQIQQAVASCLKESQFISGKTVEKFEQEFAKYLNVKYCVTVNSGTDALILGIESLNLKPGSEVIVSVNTFIASAIAISKNNLKPVFVDMDENDLGINLIDLKKKINKNTKAVLIVHLYGLPEKIDKIKKIVKDSGFDIKIIEDACQAHGSEFKDKKVGCFGEFSAFSFYPGKNLGALGDGGAIVTNNKKVYEKCLLLRNYGQIKKYDHQIIGINSRLDTLQASILSVKLKILDKNNKKRFLIAKKYLKKLSNIKQIKLPREFSNRKSNWHLFVIRAENRDALQKYLVAKGITTLIHYPKPLHLQKAYEYLNYKQGDFLVAEKISQEILSLPIFPELTNPELEYVCQEIINFYKNK